MSEYLQIVGWSIAYMALLAASLILSAWVWNRVLPVSELAALGCWIFIWGIVTGTFLWIAGRK